MKTGCRQKKLVLSLLFLSLVSHHHKSWGQYDKYRSKTNFNQEKNVESNQIQTPADIEDENNQEDPESLPEDDFTSQKPSPEDLNDNDSNQDAFGTREDSSKDRPSKDKKHVLLNPETAFGPEIVESFDFPDTDIMEITKHMQKLTGINLILDKDVKGKVSIIAPTPITVGDAWKAYLAALNMAGFSLVKSGSFYKIINARDIRYTPTKIYTGNYTPDTENYVMRVISLKSVSAAEIARNFRPFMSRYGRIIDIKQTNTIIIADTGANINRLAQMVKFLDVPGHEESLQIVPVKNSSAQEIAKLLDSILKDDSSPSRTARRNNGSSPRFAGSSSGSSESTSVISRIIAEPRTNSIIAMANAEGAKQLRELIHKLDVKLISSSSNRVHVYYLNYGDSEELSKTLSSIISGASQSPVGGGLAARRFTSPSSSDGENPIFSAEVKITSDKNNNALVVTASPTDWLTLKDVIERLDIPRDQVYVEGLILETNITKNRGFGVEYVGAHGAGNVQRAGFTTEASASNGLLNLLTTGIPQSLGGFVAGIGLGPTRDVTIQNGTSSSTVKVNAINAMIKAIVSNSSTNILATPQILALDNTEATFEVGDTVQIKNSTVGQGGVQQFNSTPQEAKLSLKITPQINKVTRFVKLKINQKIDDFKSGQGDPNSGVGLPTTTRTAITEVMVRDRDTIAMGGLLRDREIVSSNKIPLLGDIPVLGWLFKNKNKTVEKVNILFFMTPKILAPYAKTASLNTKNALDDRSKNIKTMFDEGEQDPNLETSTKLKNKLDQQIAGPLFDLTEAGHYKNLNQEDIAPSQEIKSDDNQNNATPLETPDYQEIIKSVQ